MHQNASVLIRRLRQNAFIAKRRSWRNASMLQKELIDSYNLIFYTWLKYIVSSLDYRVAQYSADFPNLVQFDYHIIQNYIIEWNNSKLVTLSRYSSLRMCLDVFLNVCRYWERKPTKNQKSMNKWWETYLSIFIIL